MSAKRSWHQTIVWIFGGVIVATVVPFVPAWEQELRKQVERA
ncbi:MAG: hypothetical protein ACHQ7N_14835 [Candidatus Methylomirabilales bacterium]